MSLPDAWVTSALEPPRAFGAPLGRGRLRAEPEDFVVEEDLGFASAGAGSHVLLKVRKRNANTEWIARELARAIGCRPGDVGYAGLKDRHALTTQWFSVPKPRLTKRAPADSGDASAAEALPPSSPHAEENHSLAAPDNANRALSDLAAIKGAEFEVLEAHAHTKKLPRGALAGNRFSIRIRDLQASLPLIEERLAMIARAGVPNYFGPQRFGRDAANLRKISRDPNTIHPRERTYVLSAARSLIFNAVLAERVTDGSWARLEVGDVANLDSRGSVFPVDALDESIESRLAALDIHPTGALWGRDALMSRARIESLEQHTATKFEDPAELVIAAGMRQERRSLRLAVRNLTWTLEAPNLLVAFWLTKGSFATTVLRELIETDDAGSATE